MGANQILALTRVKFLLSEVTRLSDNVRRTYNCTYFVLFPWQVFSFQQMYTFRTCFETVRIPYMFEVVRVVYIFDIVPCAALLRSSFHRTKHACKSLENKNEKCTCFSRRCFAHSLEWSYGTLNAWKPLNNRAPIHTLAGNKITFWRLQRMDETIWNLALTYFTNEYGNLHTHWSDCLEL